MKIRKCSCGHYVTTKEAIRPVRDVMGIWFTCPKCESTPILKDHKSWQAYMKGEIEYFVYPIKKERAS